MLFRIKMREPDFYVGGKENPYLRRWWLTSRVPEKSKVYLHHFLRDDEDRALHDHPSKSISLILWRGYIEHLPNGIKKRRYPGQLIFRTAEQPHRIELFKDKNGKPKTAWTVFYFGPKIREWGFHCPKGWVPWYDFVDANDTGSVGKGCD